MSEESRTGLDPDRIPKRRGLHIHDIKEEEPEPKSTVGTELRDARVAAGKTLVDVGTALRIRPELLEALETGQISKLPGRPYAIGFVRSYSEYMGLDSDDLVTRFKRELDAAGQSAAEAAEAAAAGVASGRRSGQAAQAGSGARRKAGTGVETDDEPHIPPLTIAIVVLLLIAVIFGGWYLTRPSDGEEQPAPSNGGAGGEPAEKPAPSADLLPSPAAKPPVLPVSQGPSATPGGSQGSSLSALLPGSATLAGTAAAESGTGDAVPANSVAAGPSGFAAPSTPAAAPAATPAGEAADGDAADGDAAAETGESRADRLAQAAMPSPNLRLRTEPSRAPGQALAGDNAPRATEETDEPALEEIEADSVGGAVESEPPPPPAKPKPQPKKKPARQEAEVFGAANAQSRVTLRMRSSAWVQVVDGQGRVIIERNMRSGDSFRAPDIANLYLVTEDAGAVELLLDGRSIGQAGVAKQVLTGLLLEPNQLEKRVAANIAAQSQ